MIEVKATDQSPYPYTMSGLKNVFLVGISTYTCPSCGENYPVIPKVGELHRVISHMLIEKKEALAGEEIRFLRKNAAFSGTDFAALIQVRPETLSRAENGHSVLSATADKMVRAIAEAASDGEHVRDLLLNKLNKLKDEGKSTRKAFKIEDDRWLQLELVA